MFITNLFLENFRNYSKVNITPDSGLNIFLGMNAQGKTNILESIYFLSTGSSHRAIKDLELLRWGQDFFRLHSKISIDNRVIDLEYYFTPGKKQVKINGCKKNRLVDGLFHLRVVLFCPDDLQLVKGGPSERRKYLDNVINQVNPTYYHDLITYQKILAHKNNLLKIFRDNKEEKVQLDIWNQQLSETGSRLLYKRLQAVSKLAPLARKLHKRITDGIENLEIRYQSSLSLPPDWTIKGFEKALFETFTKIRAEELRRGTSLVGPHRDDLSLFVENKELKTFGSQGQQRTGALSLKLSELEFIKEETKEYPVLLLDDVMSELDANRKKFLLNELIGQLQIFITTTNREDLSPEILKEATIFNVDQGILNREVPFGKY